MPEKFATPWAIGESGASGPSANVYGDAAGHAALAVVGPVETSVTAETGLADRQENMGMFWAAALKLFEEALAGSV